MDTNTLIALGIGAILIAVIVVALLYRGGIRVWGEGHGFKGGVEGKDQERHPLPQQFVEDVRADSGDATVRSSTGLDTTVRKVHGRTNAMVDLSDASTSPKEHPPASGGR